MAVKQAAVDKINGMTKSQIKSLLENIDLGMANEELRPYAETRMAALTPKSNPLFPKQADLDKLISQRDGLNAKIKALAEEATAGGFSFKTEAAGRMRNTGRPSKGAGGGAGKSGNTGGKQQVMTITTDGKDFPKWVDVARHYGISPERMADDEKRNQTDWKKYIFRAGKSGTVKFLDTEGGRNARAAYVENKWLDGSLFEIVE